MDDIPWMQTELLMYTHYRLATLLQYTKEAIWTNTNYNPKYKLIQVLSNIKRWCGINRCLCFVCFQSHPAAKDEDCIQIQPETQKINFNDEVHPDDIKCTPAGCPKAGLSGV